MHISVEKTTLLKILAHCSRVVEKKITLPILSSVLIHAREGHISVIATDLDIEFVASAPAMVLDAGKACVSAALLHDIIKKLPERSMIDMKVIADGSRLQITSNRSKFEVGCLPSDDFPDLTKADLTHTFQMPVLVFKDMINTCRDFISANETKYNLNGIFFHHHMGDTGMMLRAVASDMHRLACVQYPAPAGIQDLPPAIVSRKAINEIDKMLEESKDSVNLGFSLARVEVKINTPNYSAVLTSRLIDALFPEYEEALLVPNDKTLHVSTKEFIDSVDRVGSVVNGAKLRAVRIHVESDCATLSAISPEFGSAVEDIDVSFSSVDPVDVCCNITYIIEAASRIPTDEMELLLQDEDSSILIRPLGSDSHTFILMPMQM